MIKFVMIGLWGCGVALLASYSAIYNNIHQGKLAGSDQNFVGIEYKKTKQLNIPVIDSGVVQGYIVVQFVFTLESKDMKTMALPTEIYILDEAFKIIYSSSINFNHIEKYDVKGLTRQVLQNVREKMKSDTVKDILIEQFNFLEKATLHK